MSDARTMIRDFSWRDLFPWLVLVRAFRLSWNPPLVALALAAAVVSSIGWRLGEFVFIGKPTETTRAATRADIDVLRQFPGQGARPGADLWRSSPDQWTPGRVASLAFGGESAPARAYGRLVRPIGGLMRTESGLADFGYYLFGFLWTVAAWAIPGGAICRVALVDLGREEHVATQSAAKMVASRFADYFVAPLYPAIGVAFFGLPVALLSLLARSDWGASFVGLLWGATFLVGLFAAVMAVWLVAGWPLMWNSIGVKETGDSFDAMSQSFSFTFGRPLHYAFYAVVAYVLGAFAWAVVAGFVDAGLYYTGNLASWGAGGGRVVSHLSAETSSGVAFASWLAWAIVDAWSYSYLWTLSAAIFLLLRYDAERAEHDEVWLEAPTATMPEPKVDAAGVPEISPRTTHESPPPNHLADTVVAPQTPQPEGSAES